MISNPSDNNIDRPLIRPVCPSSPPASSRLTLRDPALTHLRTPSSNVILTPFQTPMPIPIHAPVPKRTDALNPHAKPFMFASSSRCSSSFSSVTLGPQVQLQQHLQQQPHIPQPPRRLAILMGPHLANHLTPGRNRMHLHSRRCRICPCSPCHSRRQPFPPSPRRRRK